MPSAGRSLTVVTLLGVTSLVLATSSADAPDSCVNDVSGAVEVADTPWSGTNYNVRHVIKPGGGAPLEVTMLTSNPLDDLGARLAIAPTTGNTWVVWWRDGLLDQVLVRKRTLSSGAWTSERVESSDLEGSRRPSVASSGSSAWLAYEADAAAGQTAIKAKVIEDDPSPFVAATLVGTTVRTADLDLLVQSESGHVWLSWIESTTDIRWSQYNASTATWTAPASESYATDSISAARSRIRTKVLGS